jgi:hypothetical protein
MRRQADEQTDVWKHQAGGYNTLRISQEENVNQEET